MKRALGLSLALCLVAAIALAQYGKPSESQAAPPAAKPDFEMTATYIEACSCDMFCPCYFNTRSTQHGHEQFCRANLVFRVDKGYYRDTKLDGAKVWLASDLGSDWATGKDSWLAVNYDAGVTPAQRAALDDIIGQLYPLKWTWRKTDTVPFDWKIDTAAGIAQTKMHNGKGEVFLERVAGDDPKKEVVVHNLKYWGAQSNNGFRMWKSKHESYEGQGQKFDYSGTNGFLITIHFSGQAKSAAAD